MTTRRNFIKNTAGFSAGLGIASIMPQNVKAMNRIFSANEKINVGLVGCRGHGFGILKHHMKQPNAECIALCDVDQKVLDDRAADVKEIQGKKPKLYKDFRKFLENKDIDAVIIGTPDHWHALITVAACEAGKDVYVEKPMANSIEECNVMVKATRKYNRVVQVGQQQRSGKHWRDIMDFIKSGKIGTLRKIKVWGNFHYGIGREKVPDSPPPKHVDFDFWLGPAPERSFNASRFHGSWRMFWDYGGGLMTDWGVHLLDMALWAKDVSEPPKSVAAYGGNFSFDDHAHETPDTLSVVYEMDDFAFTWDHVAGTQNGPYDRLYGLAFTGDNGTLVADRGGWEVHPEWRNDKWAMEEVPLQKGRNYHEDHVKNFLSCIKTREEPNCPVETGWLAAAYAHMGNLAWRAGSVLHYDKNSNIFIGNAKATQLITPEYRNPWKLPKL